MAHYTIDPLHSDVEFSVKHLMISTVRGRFQQFEAKMESSKEDFSDLHVSFGAVIDSISTGVTDRDVHLKTADFFDAAQWPTLSFNSTGIEMGAEGKFTLLGDLTIRGESRPIRLAGVYNGCDLDLYGVMKYGFELVGELSRKAWGLTFNATSAGGNALVGDIVKLMLSVQMVRVP